MGAWIDIKLILRTHTAQGLQRPGPAYILYGIISLMSITPEEKI